MIIGFYVIVLLLVALVTTRSFKSLLHRRIERRTVSELDLERYMGTWYEIARLETRFERGMTAVKAEYRLLEDGTVEVINSGTCPETGERNVSLGRARKGNCPGQLKVSFLGFFSAPYNVLDLGDHYEWALVGSHSYSYLWILSRTPRLDATLLEEIKLRAREYGYDTEKLLMVDQGVQESV